MRLLLDIGNTHSHFGTCTKQRINRDDKMPTDCWQKKRSRKWLVDFIGKANVGQAIVCSVVPAATRHAMKLFREMEINFHELTHENCGIQIDYPRPSTIGSDRLANARGGLDEFGGPLIVVDFGTAVTLDIVSSQGKYIGGVIAPGLSAMTDYLQKKTALLPKIQLRDPRTVIGKNTEQAMQIGAVYGYRGLVQGLISEIKSSLRIRKLSVVATGGYASLIACDIKEISAVRPRLTLDGLRLASNGWS
jgi:type III pantothenate kinase